MASALGLRITASPNAVNADYSSNPCLRSRSSRTQFPTANPSSSVWRLTFSANFRESVDSRGRMYGTCAPFIWPGPGRVHISNGSLEKYPGGRAFVPPPSHLWISGANWCHLGTTSRPSNFPASCPASQRPQQRPRGAHQRQYRRDLHQAAPNGGLAGPTDEEAFRTRGPA